MNEPAKLRSKDSERLSETEKPHQNITLTDRSYLKITGVEDVASFDENGILLISNMGQLLVDGRQLKILRLSVETGELEITGEIGGVLFLPDELPRKRKLFGRSL